MERPTQAPVPEDKLDRRVRRTRRLLQGGLLELMKHKPVASISMRELCRAVDICRTTPYLHYKDVLDILEQMEQALLLELEALLRANPPLQAARNPNSLLCGLYACAKARPQLFDVLLNYGGDPAFLQRLQALAEDYIQEYLLYKLPNGQHSAYAAAFLLGAVAAMLRRYVAGNCAEAPEALAAMTPRLSGW